MHNAPIYRKQFHPLSSLLCPFCTRFCSLVFSASLLATSHYGIFTLLSFSVLIPKYCSDRCLITILVMQWYFKNQRWTPVKILDPNTPHLCGWKIWVQFWNFWLELITIKRIQSCFSYNTLPGHTSLQATVLFTLKSPSFHLCIPWFHNLQISFWSCLVFPSLDLSLLLFCSVQFWDWMTTFRDMRMKNKIPN